MSQDVLKHIDTRISNTRNNLLNTLAAKQEINPSESEQHKALNVELKNLKVQLKNLNKERKELIENNKGVVVTEHAMLRYFERVLGYNLDEIRAKIVPEKTINQIQLLRSGVFPVDEFKIKVKKGVVITILIKDK